MEYKTNFSRGCFHHWTASKAVMELVQNWLDSDGEQYSNFGDDYLELTNKDIKVSNKLLMMGKSDKRFDETKRGQFGVGSIQAMVVLTDLGITVEILNNDVKWTPVWKYCENFQEDVMVINEESCNNGNDFTILISGLSETDLDEVKQRCLLFQDREVLHSTEYGDIIENIEGEGEVFCGDLYICQNRQFKYSYNFKPKVIKLSQDRDAVSQWDMAELTSKLIHSTGDADFIKESIRVNSVDTQALNRYSWDVRTDDEVNDSFAEEFLEAHGAKLVAKTYDEQKENERLGNDSVYIQNTKQANAILSSGVYQEAIKDLELNEKEPFSDLIGELLEEFDKLIGIPVPDNYDELLALHHKVRERVENSDYD